MKGKKCAALLTAAVLFTAALTGCSGTPGDASGSDVSDSGKPQLKVATNAEFAPWETLVNGEYVGADMDIIRAIADKLGMEVVYQNMEFDSVIASLVSKKSDVAISGLTITQKRESQVDFTDPYYKAAQVLIVRSDDTVFTGTTKEELDEQLKGKKIGVCGGFTGESYVKGDPDWPFEPIEGAEAVIYDNISLAVQGLKNSKIDVIVMDGPTANEAAAVAENKDAVKVIDVPLTVERYAIGVQKGNTDLMNKVNGALKELQNEGKIAEILAKYDMEVPADL